MSAPTSNRPPNDLHWLNAHAGTRKEYPPEEGGYRCAECGRRFATITALLGHRLVANGGRVRSVPLAVTPELAGAARTCGDPADAALWRALGRIWRDGPLGWHYTVGRG